MKEDRKLNKNNQGLYQWIVLTKYQIYLCLQDYHQFGLKWPFIMVLLTMIQIGFQTCITLHQCHFPSFSILQQLNFLESRNYQVVAQLHQDYGYYFMQNKIFSWDFQVLDQQVQEKPFIFKFHYIYQSFGSLMIKELYQLLLHNIQIMQECYQDIQFHHYILMRQYLYYNKKRLMKMNLTNDLKI
ncbi:unnamed protein product [Paramecium primaurelia]|uniref:Uncharacterized protein n=1 Tax=Paramecium primaurelia TaxID=5886 RepID=A0A8S1M9R1_PARPR|nr:unnamed protein product [Paramecium primaurelia]